MTVEELNAKLADLQKRLETVEGEAVHQIKAQIAAVESDLAKLMPKEVPQDPEPKTEPSDS